MVRFASGNERPTFVVKRSSEASCRVYCHANVALYAKTNIKTEVSLSTYIRPSTAAGPPQPDASWLVLLFIPAAFSFVCPTEVLAFQNCHDEFRDRHCGVAFVSTDSKHTLWHWQNIPRQYGGLGGIDIPLLSDASHKISRDYGVFVEAEGVSLRGMFIVDGQGFVQQVCLSDLTNSVRSTTALAD